MNKLHITNYTLPIALLLCASCALHAADTVRYTLPMCREMARTNSTTTRVQAEAKQAALYRRKAAGAAMAPRLSANAGYLYSSQDIHLLADEMTFPFGTAGIGANGMPYFLPNRLPAVGSAADMVADTYQQLYDALTVDMHSVLVAQVGITQPVYTGGRLRELYRIAQAAERMADIEADAQQVDLMLKVDEAYWRVVSVEKKKQLADYYYDLLVKLEGDVDILVQEGMATRSDLLKVTAKRGEAAVKQLQAENGLTLSRMALAQLCGLPLGSTFVLDDSGLDRLPPPHDSTDIASAVAQRAEIRLLEQAQAVARSHTRIAAAGLQPNIAASANYLYSNPSFSDGISDGWRHPGTFTVGVVVNVPIAHADDILRVKAAKHEEQMLALKTEEAREMMTLQTTQAQQKWMEAQQKVALANLNLQNAQEVLRMAEESFQSSMATASDLMQAQTAWLSAASDKVDAEIEAKQNEAVLKKYIGE